MPTRLVIVMGIAMIVVRLTISSDGSLRYILSLDPNISSWNIGTYQRPAPNATPATKPTSSSATLMRSRVSELHDVQQQQLLSSSSGYGMACSSGCHTS